MDLDRLLGTWDLTMRHREMAEAVTGRQCYERVLDGAFVRLTWTYDHPDFPDVLAMLTEGEVHYFDVRGVVRVLTVSDDGDAWTQEHLAPGFSQRHVARFTTPDTIETVGERSADEGRSWEPDYTMTLVRRSDRPD